MKTVHDVVAVIDGSSALDEMRKDIDNFLIIIRNCISDALVMTLPGLDEAKEWGVKIFVKSAGNILVTVYYRGEEKGVYMVGKNPLPLEVVVPLYNVVLPQVLMEAEKDPQVARRLQIHRTAAAIMRARNK